MFVPSVPTLVFLLAASRTVVVQLAYAPPEEPAKIAAPASLAPFALAVADARPESGRTLGTKTRDAEVRVVTTDTDLAAFAAEALASALRAAGARVEAGAPLRLEGLLLRADVEESWGFTARVRVAWTLMDATATRWEKPLTGRAKRASVLPNGEQYSAVLSEAARDLAATLLADPELLAALGGPVPRPPAAVEAPPASGAAPPADARPPTTPPATAPLATPTPAGPMTPEAMFDELQRLGAAQLDPETIAAWVSRQRLSRPLTVDEIVAWKKAGVPPSAIRAAIDGAP